MVKVKAWRVRNSGINARRIKANQADSSKSKQQENEIEKITAKTALRQVKRILKNEIPSENHFTISSFAILLFFAFRASAITGFLSLAIGLYKTALLAYEATWQGFLIFTNICSIIIRVFLWVICALYSVILWGASNEIERERDKDFVVAVFSGIVSLVALIMTIMWRS